MRRLLSPLLAALLLVLVASTPAQTASELELLAPRADSPGTPRDFVNVLGRTLPGAQVRVAGETVTVHGTGIFVRDRLPLALGPNPIQVDVSLPDGRRLSQTLTVMRVPPAPVPLWPADRLWLDGSSLQPAQDLQVAPGEAVEVSLRATPGQRVQARLPGQAWQVLAEPSPGRYRAMLSFDGPGDVSAGAVQLQVGASRSSGPRGQRAIRAQSAAVVGQWRHDPARLAVAGPDGAVLLHGLHTVRLGGPHLADVNTGTLLAVTGRQGDHLRVQLAPDTVAWVASPSVAIATAGTAAPAAAFTHLSVSGSAEGDVVQVPLPEHVPVAPRVVTDAAGRQSLEVDIFNTHHATTWISHRASARLVREVTAQQAGPGRVRLQISLHAPRLWGWRLERTATALQIVLRAAPALQPTGSPLAGLRVALEAGHGSANNLGAVGATGIPEKDINRWTTEALKAELEAAGADVVMVREADENPSLRERANRVTASGAHLFVSVHGNAADTGNGYLRVSGTSTYYKHATGRDLAAAVQQRLLADTGLADFGLVGNFNYAPIRLVTWMPAVLVEQAFLSHPGDEARLLDPAFRATMARAVRLGLEDFLRQPK